MPRAQTAASNRHDAVVNTVGQSPSAPPGAMRYSSDAQPGIARRRAGIGFSYRRPDGTTLRDPEALARIRSLAIPPAWTDVWICLDPMGHIQATGRDARGRKQYRYHPNWRRRRDTAKYRRLVEFGRALPRIRARVRLDLARAGLPHDRVLALIVRLLETTSIRVGNREYEQSNRSFGLTTLKSRHVRVDGGELRFRFRGKGGKVHEVDFQDRRLARIVARCQELPGQELFQYLDESGEPRTIESTDVNDYLRDAAGIAVTAKDFRTWTGTMLAFGVLRSASDPESPATKRTVTRSTETVAEILGNTAAVTRGSYIAPAVIDAYLAGSLPPGRGSWASRGKTATGLDHVSRRDELALIRLLRRPSDRRNGPPSAFDSLGRWTTS
jgi:DNA topoisomerase-1